MDKRRHRSVDEGADLPDDEECKTDIQVDSYLAEAAKNHTRQRQLLLTETGSNFPQFKAIFVNSPSRTGSSAKSRLS